MFGIFKKKHPVDTQAALTVDFHSHFLPGLDDGCKTMEESIELIKLMKNYGYRKLIMSPHNMGDFYKNTPEIIRNKLDEVKAELKNQQIEIVLDATAEYYLDEWLDEKIKTKNLLPFGGNKILFEISYVNEPKNLFQTIFNLQVAGYEPVLAHPERYNFFHQQFDVYEKMFEQGCRLQLNLLSLTGYYGYAEKKTAEKLINKNMIYYVGSDAHSIKHVTLLKDVFKTSSFIKLSHQIHNEEI